MSGFSKSDSDGDKDSMAWLHAETFNKIFSQHVRVGDMQYCSALHNVGLRMCVLRHTHFI